MKWKAVIFDRDGTLFDSLAVILRSFNYGIEPFTDRRPSDSEWFAAFGPAEPEVMGRFIPAEKKEAAFDRFYCYYQEHIGEIALFEGVSELLFRLKEGGMKLGLFTGGGRTSTRFCLEKRGVLSLFDVLITGDDVALPKPHPEGIHKAVDFLNVKPEQTVVVGDSGADIQAGGKAGTTTVMARWSEVPLAFDFSSQPDYIFYRVSELDQFLTNGSTLRKESRS